MFLFWFVLTVITEIREIQIDWSGTVQVLGTYLPS